MEVKPDTSIVDAVESFTNDYLPPVKEKVKVPVKEKVIVPKVHKLPKGIPIKVFMGLVLVACCTMFVTAAITFRELEEHAIRVVFFIIFTFFSTAMTCLLSQLAFDGSSEDQTISPDSKIGAKFVLYGSMFAMCVLLLVFCVGGEYLDTKTLCRLVPLSLALGIAFIYFWSPNWYWVGDETFVFGIRSIDTLGLGILTFLGPYVLWLLYLGLRLWISKAF